MLNLLFAPRLSRRGFRSYGRIGSGLWLAAMMPWLTASGLVLAQDVPPPPPNAPSDLAPLATETGTVRGTFTSFERLQTRGATSQRDVVIYLRSVEPGDHAPSPLAPAAVVQRNLRFEPHVLALLRGTTIRFVNEDNVVHNVYSASECCAIDIDTAAHASKAHVFDQPGIVPIVCRLHPEMSLWLVVLEEPWFAHVQLKKQRPAKGKPRLYTGEYAIRGVPPGPYTLTFWNKKIRAREYEVVVQPGVDTVLDVEIGKNRDGPAATEPAPSAGR
ncbi:MAG: carboxypeptidase regulatory-like domain-containing protein [Planctomycetota bacterium]